MNLEQIVKETVAKIVAEKELTAAEEKKREEIVKAMKKDFKGPAPAMYAIATDKAKKLAESDPQTTAAISNAIEAGKIDPKKIEAAAIKASQGNADDLAILMVNAMAGLRENELNEDYEVAMAQDSLDSIIRAAMMLKAQMGDKEINLPAWIQDHITNAENYIYQAAKGYHESDAQMDDKAGAEEMDESNNDKIEKYKKYTYTLDGEVVKPEITFLNNILKAMLGNKIYNIGAPENGKVELSPESGKKGMYNEAEDISDDELAQLQATADDTSKMPAERDAARNKIYASRAKKEQQELDEWTVRRWQHYAGIR